MNKIKQVLLATLLLASMTAQAQLHYGIKTGLNFARIKGPSELDNTGAALEDWKSATGFHIGIGFSYKFSDHFGARGEFMYSKAGGRYSYDGDAHRVFNYTGGSSYATGHAKYLLNISNAYLKVPVSVYAKAGDFEFSAGPYVAVLVQSTAEGSLLFSGGKTENNSSIEDIEYFLDYNYRKDDSGAAVSGSETHVVRVDNRNIDVPKTVGAYYDYTEDRGKLFNSLDYGVVGGVSWYLTGTLYLNVGVQFGLADVTNDKADLAKSVTGPNHSPVYRSDKDRNFAISTSIGFSF